MIFFRTSFPFSKSGERTEPPELRLQSNRDGSAADPRKASSSKSLRPYDIPYATGNSNAAAVNTTAGTAASAEAGKVPGGIDDKGIVLRCMYTNQKTKKRKTWSDGAVKCCPKRQRVSLYRWSEALGVTEKLLGEVYLTVPQYEAFITQGEPELEMELLRRGDDGDDAGGRSASHYPENQRCGRDGAVTAAGGTGGREENTFGRGNAIGGAGARVPEEVDRETPGYVARVEMRSTQDILSLFGGFGGTPSTQGGHDHGSHGRETAETQRHGPTEAPLGSQASGDALRPVGGGIRRAADMHRAQKEARAAAATVAPGGGAAGAATGASSARGAPNDDAVMGDWVCGTCGVRGDPSSASCRVCGAKREGLRSDGVAQGGDDGVRGGIGSQEGRVGWGRGDDFGGGGRRQEKASEGGAGDVGDRPVTLGIAEGLEAGGAPGRWRTSSPDRPAFPQSRAGGGGEGACGVSVLETPSSCQKIGPRMQMDMGSSSDSDDA
ncbi:hypothetical protein Esi_0066_0069 [Ectocarpus siliculosus]|uniref:RanBP2-type domain-containing protein n=1 Tax=Ectocarpus siliculosus TaxID=2880 RepID=D8LRG4_ECTSI|nr:hypothetical protein Esi_0066_0069 [Ectocarpus siliculosus]|eukprot:CBN75065.1 hypothetical protein Esi_0066_0069 [Ectocarpus siliculosus]